MTPPPRISVVIPTFNRASYIGEAIDSVLAQTYHDFEIIVVDDGSTDNTADVLKKYYGVVRSYRQANRGPGAARNFGVHHARGAFLAFLDSDDLWLPNKLEVQIAALDADPGLAFVCAETYVINEGGETVKTWKKNPRFFETFADLREDNFITTLTVLLRKSSFEAVEGFDERLSNAQDYDLWLRLTKAGFKFRFINQPLGKCRFHESNNTKNTDGRVRSYELLLNKKEIWESMPFFRRRKRLSQIYFSFAQAYLSTRHYAKAAVHYKKAALFNPFAGYFCQTESPASPIFKILRLYYLILKCSFKSLSPSPQKFVL
jgi:glycosyltransferase involved in cell wall biosynthesis